MVSTTTAEQLSAAFAEFEDASQSLAVFYRDLESRVVDLTRELSASRRAQARELAEKQRLAARLENLLQALPGGVVVIDQHGDVQQFNPVAEELLGPLAAGTAWNIVVQRAFAPRPDDGHDVSLKDGRRVNIATQAMSNEPGQILLITDVSETRRLQDQLSHHKRLSAKTEMAAALAHQVRTPLATALLYVGQLTQRTAADPAARRAAERSADSLRKLERLVGDMLLFARGGRLDVDDLPVSSLAAAITDAAAGFNSERFEVSVAGANIDEMVYANLDALVSVSLNLIENASEACRDGGRLEIRFARDGDMLEIRFHDNGPGIPEASVTQLFEPFFTTRSQGTGLGLAVARSVAVAHGGSLELDSDCTSGTAFCMRLPLSRAAQLQPIVAAVTAGGLQ